MKRSKIALALGALAFTSAGVAHAQTLSISKDGATLTVYGDVDYYLSYMTSSSGSKLIALQDGAYLRTRLGFKGDKDLGSGYAVKFNAEQGLNETNGAQADATRLFDRQLWAGVATPFGEFRFGRQNTAIFYRGGYIDFTARTLGSVVNNFGTPSRYDSDIAYISPRWAGFLAEAHYSIQGSQPQHTTNQAVYQGALDYEHGPFRIGYAGIAGKPPEGSVVDKTVSYNTFYGNWDYGKGKVYLVYIRSNNQSTTAGTVGTLNNGGNPLGTTGALVTGTDPGANTYYNISQVSADYWIHPKVRIGALYGKIKDATNDVKNADGWGVGAYWDVTKELMVYGLGNSISNDPGAGFRPSGSAGLTKTFTTAADVNGQRIRMAAVGMVYKF
ncbi:MAG TPA: porin [Burkholderiales bacterium]|nr:porin [Burkholderiales bacterium]